MTKKDLEEYRLLEFEIKSLKDRISGLEVQEPPIERDKVQGSSPEFPYQPINVSIRGVDHRANSRRQTRIRRLKRLLKSQMEEAESLKTDIEEFIADIPDRTLRQIFTYRYIDGLTQQQIGEKMCMERSSVSKKIDAFLKLSHKSHKSHS